MLCIQKRCHMGSRCLYLGSLAQLSVPPLLSLMFLSELLKKLLEARVLSGLAQT